MPHSAPHFTVDRDSLAKELGLAIGAVERRTTIPILEHVRLEASGGTLTITATDLEIGMSCTCPAKVKNSGVATLPAKRLLDYVRVLPEGAAMEIKFSDNHWASITCGTSRSRIAGLSVENFPDDLPLPAETACAIPVETIARLIRQSSYAISTEESRFSTNGALLEMSAESIRMIATDGHRLAISSADGVEGRGVKVLVPRKALIVLLCLAGDCPSGSAIEFSSDDNHLFFSFGGRVLMARRMAGNFPDYARAVPKSFAGMASVVDNKGLADAIHRVRGFADQMSRAMKVVVGDGKISLSSKLADNAYAEDEVEAEVNGSVEIGFNADYLIDFLKNSGSASSTLYFNDALSPMQMGGSDQHCCVISPIRL